MGTLINHDIHRYIDTYKSNIFIETGTGLGMSFQHAQKHNFDKLYTIEIIDYLHTESSNRYKSDNSFFILNNSKDGLISALEGVDQNDRILFWMDAHFPAADFQVNPKYPDEVNDINLPLESELRVICNKRNTKSDVFIIDDLRIYEDGEFQDGNWKERPTTGSDNIGFIYELFSNTHKICKDYRDQGYILITPIT